MSRHILDLRVGGNKDWTTSNTSVEALLLVKNSFQSDSEIYCKKSWNRCTHDSSRHMRFESMIPLTRTSILNSSLNVVAYRHLHNRLNYQWITNHNDINLIQFHMSCTSHKWVRTNDLVPELIEKSLSNEPWPHKTNHKNNTGPLEPQRSATKRFRIILLKHNETKHSSTIIWSE